MASQNHGEDSSSDVEEVMEVVDPDDDAEADIDDDKKEERMYLPGDPIEGDEELIQDESAYQMYHQAQTGAPCLSFDILWDKLGEQRTQYPHTSYLVAGTQAEKVHLNSVIVMKMGNLHSTQPEEEDSDSDSDEDDDNKPHLETAMINHLGSINRIRATVIGKKQIAATWADTGKVQLWDLTQAIEAVDSPVAMERFTMQEKSHKSLYTFSGHQIEGFAIDWSPTVPGTLVTGDCKKNIHVWKLQEGGTWHVDQRPYAAHTESIEDLQWSPNEKNVFASCSVDKTIRVWDVRAMPSKACMITQEQAHDSDINVIHWNRNDPFIASGGDDGVINIWDLRQMQKKGPPVAKFKHHTAPITSIEWHPTDSTVFAAAGSDDQITLWDLAVEKDDSEESSEKQEGDQIDSVPPQLLFIHQGQTDIKELHWHPQIPGMVISTAHSGFNLFRTISV
ncbi:glutamate-rich WD repeat-containing protein 1-like [Amphiura filiformis]|uniref:glutamate-rich WD repeat-containing protein 1-like n=1 Tax=Amphiura filiformis TaxID=82378 RepID=UPI003B215F29